MSHIETGFLVLQAERGVLFSLSSTLLSSQKGGSMEPPLNPPLVLKLTGLLYRRFRHCNPQTMLRLYKSIIRPHLKYAPQVWDPHLHKDINLLEKSQKFALQVCTRNWSASYEDLLNTTHVSSLSDRRKAAKLCHLYKLVYNLIDCQNAPVVVRDPIYSRCRNPIQLQQVSTHTSQFHSSFYPDTISLRNKLPIRNDSLLSFCSSKRSVT